MALLVALAGKKASRKGVGVGLPKALASSYSALFPL
jgi:hypothetical protein